MSLRTHCVEWPFATRRDVLPAGTVHTWATEKMWVADTLGRRFVSVTVEVTARTATQVALSLQDYAIGVRLGSANWSEATVVRPLATSGRCMSHLFTLDATDYFESAFGAGTRADCTVRFRTLKQPVANLTCKLTLVFAFEDRGVGSLQKTVKVPFEGFNDSLGDVLDEMGDLQVPALADFCPEAGKTFDRIWFEVETHEAVTTPLGFDPRRSADRAAQPDYHLALALDGEAEVLDGVHEGGLGASCHYRTIWNRNDLVVTAPHRFRARSTVKGRFNCLHARLCATYRYDPVLTTRVLSSLELPCHTVDAPVNDLGTRVPLVASATLHVNEPGALELRHSAVVLQAARYDRAPGTLRLGVGERPPREFGVYTGSTTCGVHSLSYRIDGPGGLSLHRGENHLAVEYRFEVPGAAALGAPTAIMYLNYVSDKASQGTAAHNQTRRYFAHTSPSIAGMSTAAEQFRARKPQIAEPAFYVSNAGFVLAGQMGANRSTPARFALVARRGDGDGPPGWETLVRASQDHDGQVTFVQLASECTRLFLRHPQDPRAEALRLDASREIRSAFMSPALVNVWLLATWHGVTVPVNGHYLNARGDGSGVTVDVHRTDTGERVARTVTGPGGAYATQVYDATLTYRAVAEEDAGRVGASAAARPGE